MHTNSVIVVSLCLSLQMRCVGGTAGCHAFQPRVVQCINRGSDGYDVQVPVCGVCVWCGGGGGGGGGYILKCHTD